MHDTQEQKQEIPTVGNLVEKQPVIQVRSLSFWYQSVIGLNNVSIDIGAGVIGLLGPNGAGKSTFMKLLTGQLLPQTGSVSICGRSIRQNTDLYSKIGFVPEQDAFYEEMTGLEFVTYLTELQGFSHADAENLAIEALKRVSLEDKMRIKIHKYSKGMRQRTKIAQALAHDPQILFLDEPLTGTDPVGRRAIINLVRELGNAGKTILVSSHILHEVQEMTRAVIMINKGKIIADGDIYEIRSLINEHPQTIQVFVDRPRDFGRHLILDEHILSIDFDDDYLNVRTKSPDNCYAKIANIALEHDFHLKAFSSTDNNLQAIFDYLVEG